MIKITLNIDGMRCAMCEAHVNDAIRRALAVKRVTSSRSKGQTVILAERDIDETALRAAIAAAGYELKAVTKEVYEKKGLFRR